MEKIKARLYGNSERQGRLVEFKVVKSLPEKGNPVNYGDPYYTWGEIKPARLDPEQRTRDDDKHYRYEFYEAEELDEDGEYGGTHYLALERKKKTYYVYIDGVHTDTIEEEEGYTADDYRIDYNTNWAGQPEELTDETIELVEQPE